MTDPIQNALEKIRKLADEAKTNEEKYYHLESSEAVNHFHTMNLAYRIALEVLEKEIYMWRRNWND